MKNTITAALCAVALLAASPVFGTDAKGDVYFIRGLGLSSCGAWLQDRRTNAWFPAGQWFFGYVTAFNLWQWRTRSDDVGDHVDIAGLMAWVDTYCASHPIDALSDAAIDLVADLAKKYDAKHPRNGGKP